jgi:hypothetical protein
MASRKQRRRRAKERRHEWEDVWVDEEGNEVEPPDDADDAAAPSRSAQRASAPRQRQSGVGRHVNPPSWRRVVKRGVLFAPVMFLLLTFLSNELTLAQRAGQTALLLAFFLPFSYAMDALMYRMFVRRGGATAGRKT